MEIKYEEKSNELIINMLQAENRFMVDAIFQLTLHFKIFAILADTKLTAIKTIEFYSLRNSF